MGRASKASEAEWLPPARVRARLRVGVLAGRYNPEVTDGLVRGALAELASAGIPEARVTCMRVPGAFELPLVARALAASGKVDAVIALGAVIEGDTDHYRHVCEAATAGILRAGLDTGVPVAFGVLTTRTLAQARRRSRPDAHNKGAEAVRAALETVACLARIRKL